MDTGAQCKQAARMFTAAMRDALNVYLFLCREWKESAAPVLDRAGKEAFCFAAEICLLVQTIFGHLDQWMDLLTSDFQ